MTRGGAYTSTNVVDLAISTRLGLSNLDSALGFRVAAKTGIFNSRIALVDVIDRSNSNHATGFGRVDYLYKISKFLITNAQYVDFLNSVATTDTNSLFYSSMQSQPIGGILRFGSSGSYSYVYKPDMANRPVNYVSWHSAARYCNWLHNNTPTGSQDSSTTEDGAYTLSGSTLVDRNTNSNYFLPSEDEWVKAAYYNGTDYTTYATQSNDAPTAVSVGSDGDGVF